MDGVDKKGMREQREEGSATFETPSGKSCLGLVQRTSKRIVEKVQNASTSRGK